MSAPPRSEPHGMLPMDILGEGQRRALEQPGSALYPPLDPAPGCYVADGGPR